METIFIILVIAFASFNLNSAIPEVNNSDFKFLGSNKRLMKTGAMEGEFQDFSYFVSVNPTTHAVAKSDCMNIFGKYSVLVSIETIEENEFIINLLSQSDSTATVFWTSGEYDTRNSVWRWGTGVEVDESWAPWGSGFPLTSPSRITFYFENKFNSWWETQYTTAFARYICEVRECS